MQTLLDLFYKYSGFLLAGVIGASINKLRKRMSWKRFFSFVYHRCIYLFMCRRVIPTPYAITYPRC